MSAPSRRPWELANEPSRLAGRCSPQQERMWFLQQLAPGSGPAHNVTTASRIRGQVDLAALRSALVLLGQRHELLRTRLVSTGGAPTRVVEEIGADLLEVRNASDADLDRILTDVAMTPFDLGVTPLWRCVLVRLGPADAVVVLCLSHTIADGWSVGILHRELSDLYACALTGAGSPLMPLTESFSDWVAQAHLRRREDDGAWTKHLRFWRDQLAGAPDELRILTDHPRPAVERYVGDQVVERIGSELAAAVASTARSVGATPFSVYAAGYALLLARWAGQPEIVMGTPWANRRSVEQERLVGPLMELLLLRLAIDPQCSVGDFIRTVRKSAVRAMGHGEVSFDDIVADLRPQRSAGRNPIFQAMFLMQNAPLEPVAVPGASSELMPVATPTARLDLALDITPSGGGAIATFEYNTDLYARQTIAWAAKRYQHLLEQMVADPARPLAKLSTMDDLECGFVVAGVNQTTADVRQRPATLTGLIDQAAATWPERVALAQSGTEITYRRLREHTDHVAAGLAARGVVPGDVVAVLAHRCPQMVLALLAVMKAGAAYLPLDPNYPPDRLREVIADAGAQLVVAAGDAATATVGLGATVVELDALAELADSSPSPGSVRLPDMSSDDTAYVIYTSGSTGRPKGVMVSHRSALNYLGWAQSEFPIAATDVVVGKTPFTFDISVWEMLGTLAWGARLELLEVDKHRDAQHVAKVLADSRATVVHFVPSMLRGLLALPRLPKWPDLRLVFVGGEALAAELAGRLAEHTDAAIVNFYGPTEATIYASWQQAGTGRVATNGTVPIGGPVANTTMYVLDAAGDPVPVGAAGELYIGGPQVAQGYLRRPGLTARQFRPDPFAGVPGARMYRTGDQVRRCGDGTVDFLGRVDGQIKLRGYRIELGEIEAVLRGHPSIEDAAAAVRGEILVAHVVPAAQADPDFTQLRGYLTDRLPAHLIPARLGAVDALPHTTSGKLDRRAVAELALPAATGSDRGVATRPPAGPVELAIAESWRKLLGEEVADADANFFALGGDSISCVAVVADLARRGLSVSVADIFQSTSLAALATLATPIHAQKDQGDHGMEQIPLSEPQRRLLKLPALERVAVAGWPMWPAAYGTAPTDATLAIAMRQLEHECPGLRGDVSTDGTRIQVRPSGPGYGLRAPHHADPAEWLRTTVDLQAGVPWGAALHNDHVIVAVDTAICDSSGLGTVAARLVEILRERSVESDPGTPPQPGPISWRTPVANSPAPLRLIRLADPVTATSTVGDPPLGRITTVELVAAALARPRDGSGSPPGLFVQAPLHSWPAVGPDLRGWWVGPGAAFAEVRTALRRPTLALPELDPHPDASLLRVFDPEGTLAWARPAGALAVPEWVTVVLDVAGDQDTLTVAGYGEDAAQRVAELAQAYPQVADEATHANAYVAADFPLARLTDAELMRLSTTHPDLVDVLPLGPTQRYAVDRVVRTNLEGLYAVCFTLALTGQSFNVAAWRSTWQELMRRHPGLRTSFWLDAASGPVQLVHADPPLPFAVDDLRQVDRAQALAQVAAMETAQRLHVTDVTDVPQWQMRVIQIDDDDYRVLCRLTYLLQDGWSVSVLQHEWYPLYDAFVTGSHGVAELPPPAHSYARQLEHLGTRDLAVGRRYWSDRLMSVRTGSRAGSIAGSLTGRVAEALRVRSRPEPGLEHQTVRYVCSPVQEQALRAYARAHQLTIFTPLQGAWALTLAGLTNDSTVLFGTISSGRHAADIRRTYGSFNSMMPTAVRLAPQQSCLEFLRALQAVGSTDRANDHVSLTDIAADLGLAAVDLLDTYIVLENFPMDIAAQERFESWQPDIAEMRTEHALRMLVWPVGELSYHVSFDARFISSADAERVLHHFVRTLTSMTEHPQAPLAQFITDPLTPPEGESHAD